VNVKNNKKQIGNPKTTKYEHEYGFTFTFNFFYPYIHNAAITNTQHDTAGGRGSQDEAVDDDRNDDTAGGRGSQDEAADGENEGHGADANSDRDQNARDTHNSNDAHEVRGAYDSMPSKEEILSLADGSSLSGAREKASQEEIMRDKYAIIDHISLETCCGQKHNFHEAKHINTRFRQS